MCSRWGPTLAMQWQPSTSTTTGEWMEWRWHRRWKKIDKGRQSEKREVKRQKVSKLKVKDEVTHRSTVTFWMFPMLLQSSWNVSWTFPLLLSGKYPVLWFWVQIFSIYSSFLGNFTSLSLVVAFLGTNLGTQITLTGLLYIQLFFILLLI